MFLFCFVFFCGGGIVVGGDGGGGGGGGVCLRTAVSYLYFLHLRSEPLATLSKRWNFGCAVCNARPRKPLEYFLNLCAQPMQGLLKVFLTLEHNFHLAVAVLDRGVYDRQELLNKLLFTLIHVRRLFFLRRAHVCCSEAVKLKARNRRSFDLNSRSYRLLHFLPSFMLCSLCETTLLSLLLVSLRQSQTTLTETTCLNPKFFTTVRTFPKNFQDGEEFEGER